jgi:hypothetical protein
MIFKASCVYDYVVKYDIQTFYINEKNELFL